MLVVDAKRGIRVDDRPRLAVGTQSQVDAIEVSFLGECRHRVGETPRDARVVMHRGLVGFVAGEDEVDVTAVVELAPAELSHRDHRERSRHGLVPTHLVEDDVQHDARARVGQVREAPRHLFHGKPAHEVQHADLEQRLAVRAADGVEPGFHRAEARRFAGQPVLQRVRRVGRIPRVLLHQPVDEPRLADENVGEMLAGAEHDAHEIEHGWGGEHRAQKHRRVAGGLEVALDVPDGRVGRRRAQARVDDGEQLGVREPGREHAHARALEASRGRGGAVEAAGGQTRHERLARPRRGRGRVNERAHRVLVDVLHDGAQLLVDRVAHVNAAAGRTSNISTCTRPRTTVNSFALGSWTRSRALLPASCA